MTDITLVRQDTAPIPDADRDAARRVLFGAIDGLGDRGKKQWRRFFNGLLRLEPGEMVSIKTNKPRIGKFHRLHMLIETRVFEAQERFENFDPGFRDWLKIGAGRCAWVPGPRGGVVPIPLSISYADLEEDAMREFHDNALSFLRTAYAQKTLWPSMKDPLQRDAAMSAILSEFDE